MATDSRSNVTPEDALRAPISSSREAAYQAAVEAQRADLDLLRSHVLPVLDELDLPLSAPPLSVPPR